MKRSKPLRIARNARCQLRNGLRVEIMHRRSALSLDGRSRMPVWVGKFNDGGLCAWNLNGVYRASNGEKPHALDIVAVIR
jgi:hypothetical protein